MQNKRQTKWKKNQDWSLPKVKVVMKQANERTAITRWEKPGTCGPLAFTLYPVLRQV